MARLQSQSKLLYYPTLDFIAQLIASHFSSVAKRVRVVDPCCGTGKAIRDIVDTLPKPTQAEVFGIEMSYARALEAEKALDRVLPVSFYNVAGGTAYWSQHSVGLLYNNPPYDWSGFDETIEGAKRRVRHETLFITMATPKVQPGGHHVLVIPRGMLGDKGMLGEGMEGRIARHLLGWYEHVEIYKYPDPEYQVFKQVVVFAARKRLKYVIPQKEAVDAIVALANLEAEMPVLPEGTGEFLIPEAPEAKFEYVPVNPVDLIDHAKRFSPLGTEEYLRAVHVRYLGEPFNPAMPINIGHLTLLLAGNETGTLELFDEATGKRLLLKGSSRKVTKAENSPNVNDEGEVTSYKVVTKESHASTLAVTKEGGDVLLFSEPREVAEWVTKYGAQLGDAVLNKNKPLYEFNPTASEWEISGLTALGLPPLPGREERGLFDVQRHFAIAMARVLAARRQAILNAEMGFGKTSTFITVLELMNEWPALISAPGHMMHKWRRDLERVSIQDEPITARIITRPAVSQKSHREEVLDETGKPLMKPVLSHGQPVKDLVKTAECSEGEWVTRMEKGYQTVVDEPSQWYRVRQLIESTGAVIEDFLRWQTDPASPKDMGGRRKVIIKCDRTAARKIATSLGKTLVFKDKIVDEVTRAESPVTIEPEMQYTISGLEVVYVDKDDYTLQDFYTDYKAGRLGRKAVAIVGFEAGKYDAGVVGNQVWRTVRTYTDPNTEKQVTRKVATCPVCGKVYPNGAPRFCTGQIQDTVMVDGKAEEVSKPCKSPLYEMSRWRRVGLSRLIQRKYRHFFKVYGFDEAHKAQGGRTDIGAADQRYISAIKYGVALTGTLFGGTAGSLFYLLYRRIPELRRLYEYDDYTRWVDHFGLWENEWSQGEPYVSGVGASTGMERWGFQQRELPGVGPGVIRYLLEITAFGNITDLGYDLPDLYENVETVKMTERQSSQYAFIKGTVLRKALQLAREGDHGVISAWYTAMRFRPMSGFRDEVIDFQGRKGVLHEELPSVIGIKATSGAGPAETFVEADPDEEAADIGTLSASGESALVDLATAAMKDAVAMFNDEEIARAEAAGEWLPKEERIARMVRDNLLRGRKTLVFVEQTGTRDIRTRIKMAIERLSPDAELGVRKPVVGVLSADDMAPARREAWITANAPAFDVMIVNPKLVETGLDLVMFANLVFYETPTSLYVLWQAMRRVWRLGQKNAVEVDFLAYKGTMEEEILSRMGKKMKFAQLLYGKDAAGVLIENDGDDLAREIIADALAGRTFKDIGDVVKEVKIFSDSKSGRAAARPAPVVTAIPVLTPTLTAAPAAGILTAANPAGEDEPVVDIESLFLTDASAEPVDEPMQLGLFWEAVPASQIKKSRRRPTRVPEGQLSLFGMPMAAD